MRVILFVVLASHLVSCSDKEGYENYSGLESEDILQKYADEHNLGLDYIKLDAESVSGTYTKSRFDYVFESFLNKEYGNDNANGFPIKELVFNGTIPFMGQTRSCKFNTFTENANAFAMKALDDCMKNITECMHGIHEDELFDNEHLLKKMHAVIANTYIAYSKKCDSEVDAKALARTLGILYGSIEYWSNSTNVKCWSSINMQDDDKTHSMVASNSLKTVTRSNKSKKLSKSEWLQTVAAADAIGGLASGPAGLACSAAAALYFDVE